MRKKILLLGSGELGKEVVIAMQRLGQYVIAVDNYENAPAMQVAHSFEVINMLDGAELDRIVAKHQPDFIVPEVESIRTERFYDYEKQGYTVIPSAKAANFTMNRKAIRDLAAIDLDIKTAKYKYATSYEELKEGVVFTGMPCVVKPLMSSSGKGQSIIKTEADIEKAWNYALEGSRGDLMEIIVEAFIEGREVTNGVFLSSNGIKVLPITEIITENDFFDYGAKYHGESNEVTPADLPEDMTGIIKSLTRHIYDVLGLKGIARADYILKGKIPYLIEINTVPGQSAESIIPQMAKIEGIGMKELFEEVIYSSLK